MIYTAAIITKLLVKEQQKPIRVIILCYYLYILKTH